MDKQLLRYLGKFKKDTFITPIFVFIEALLEVLIPFLMASLIDEGIEKGNIGYTTKLGLLLLLFAVISLVMGILAARTSSRASAGYAHNLRQAMFHKVQDFSFANIDKFSTASIVTRITTDVSNVQMSFMMILRIVLRSPLMMLTSLFFAFKTNAQIAWIYVAAIPILAFALFFIVTRAHPYFHKVFQTYDKLNNVVQENLHGIRVVKSFVRKDYEIRKFRDVSDDVYTLFKKAEKISSFNMPIMQFIIYTCILLAAWFGAQIITAGGMTTGELYSIIAYANMILAGLMMLSIVFVMVTISQASIQRIKEILNEESTIKNPENPVTEVKDGSISFENVSFSYFGTDEKLCLKNVDLTIASGQTIGIIGGTGSSKSTLVQLIPRLYDVTSGCVKVGGVDVRDYDIETLRESVAMVLQKNELFSGTIKSNLRWGNENATDDELIEACKLACADEFVSKMPDGYDTRIERGGTNVSGGQKQRLCIARALLKKPKILILDDSTSAVDVATEASIRAGFRSYIPETTKIIIAQRISSVQDADAIIVMDNGFINGIGTHDELMANNSIYQEVYRSQQKGGKE